MCARVSRRQAHHFIEDAESILRLAFTTVMTHQVSILLQGVLDISLARGNLGERGRNFVLMGSGLFHLAQDGLHLLLFAGTSIGFGE